MTDAAVAPKPKKLCPKGHPSGTRFGNAVCGVRRCGEDTLALMPQNHDEDALAKMPVEERAFHQRSTLAKMPPNLTGDAATEWAQKKLVDLLPEAVASVQWDLRYGTDKVRSEAADKVLRANGLDKREASQGGGGLIVLNIGTEATKIPWLERLNKKGD